jgi:membrane protein
MSQPLTTTRREFVTGALTAAALTALHVGGRLVLPRITAAAQHQFGPLGLVFTAISWLFVLSVVIVGSAVIVKAIALDEGYVGQYLRGPAPALDSPAHDDAA